MREFIYDSWNSVMDYKKNPLRHIPDLSTRHLIMQVLAWMWCITFALIVGSWTAFGVSAIAHVALIGAIVVTVGTFKVAETSPWRFGTYHSYGRSRGYVIDHDKKGNPIKIYLDEKDPGGEHV